MSETVHYTGKIKPVTIPIGIDLNTYAKQLCEELNIKEDNYWLKHSNGNYIDLLTENREDYIYVKNVLYLVLTQAEHDLEDEIARITVNSDGTYDYEVRYYNGGAGFDEMLTECLQKIT